MNHAVLLELEKVDILTIHILIQSNLRIEIVVGGQVDGFRGTELTIELRRS